MKNISWRLVAVVVVVVAAIIYIIPTVDLVLKDMASDDPDVNYSNDPALWPHKKINLGLDLQGGMHLILEVDTDEAVDSTISRIIDDLRDLLKKERTRFESIGPFEGSKILAKIKGDKEIKEFNKILAKEFPGVRILSRTPASDGTLEIRMDLPEQETDEIKKMASAQALETIRNRIDELGVSEPDIRQQGENRILIQLPGIKDPQRAKDLIGKTALLEFKLLDESGVSPQDVADNKVKAPPGTVLVYETEINPQTNQEKRIPYLLKKRAALTGEYLTDARVKKDSQQFNEPYVSIKFDKKGAKIFERVTGANVKKRLAIVLDKNVYSAPVIQDKIAGGQASITGNFTNDEANDLAIVLRAGALPAPVAILEERTVGATLGEDSIKAGVISMCVGGILVIIFMVIYYNFSGVIADLALILNVLIIAAALAALQATLTLPGIAGIILTIGMAVDANVLIFERIREELQLGKTPHAAVNAGYDRATITILDANITTLIATVILIQFGTGPVRGFAITLGLGVLFSMFTALVMTRLIFNYLLVNRKMKTISI
ncbi:MAG: protein translocase subunit SecD [Desulfobacteraceae bacterium]|nr:protein translocase subunit SecD [Desulfobacteraceae bacterium]